MKFAVLSFCLALLATPALAQSFAVTDPTGQTITITAADLAALPRVKLTFDAHGETHEYEGPLLIVEGDLRPARSVRMVTDITVYSLGSEGDSSRPEAH